MVKVFEERFAAGIQGNKTDGYYMHVRIKECLDTAKIAIRKDWDMIFIVDGTEGVGKSVLAQQLAMYCDPSFNIDRICFNAEEFKKAILGAYSYQAIVFDEAYRGLSSRKVMSKINSSIVEMLAEIRQKNLFIFILCPTFFDLDRYVAIWRGRALIHCWHDNFERGFYDFYNASLKKELYLKGKYLYDYDCVRYDFQGVFTDFYPISKEAYKEKKATSMKKNVEHRQEKVTYKHVKNIVMTEMIKKLVSNNKRLANKLCHNEIIKLLGVSSKTFYTHLKVDDEEDIEDISE